MTIAPEAVRSDRPAFPADDPVLALAELMLRLGGHGVPVATDRHSLDLAYRHMTGALAALGVSVDAGALPESEWLLLRCVVAMRP